MIYLFPRCYTRKQQTSRPWRLTLADPLGETRKREGV